MTPPPIARIFFAVILLAAISACGKKEEASAPPPRQIMADSVAQFCNMAVTEHPGPKGQIFVKGRPDPFWFASVRDTFAFTMLPEEPKDVTAIYVSDMAKTKDWSNPAPSDWVEARTAVFVIESRKRSGMGEAEAVPFSDAEAAKSFIAENGGRMVRFDDMPKAYILPEGDVAPGAPAKMDMGPNGQMQDTGGKAGPTMKNMDMPTPAGQQMDKDK